MYVPCIFLLYILNGTSTFNAPYRKPCSIWETADDSGLPLQWTLDSFKDCGRIGQIYDIDESFRCATNQQALANIQSIHTFLHLHGCSRLLLSKVPIFQSFVPGTCDEHLPSVWRLEHPNTANGFVVGGDLLRLA